MQWEELSESTRKVMRELGNFGPTVHPDAKEVKGYMLDPDGDAGKTYYSSRALREIADACKEVADWLDKRAMESPTSTA